MDPKYYRSSPPTAIGQGACSVIWKDSVIIFGGSSALTVVQQFNFTSQLWKKLAPMGIAHYWFGCVVLPQNKNEVLLIKRIKIRKKSKNR